MEVAVSVSGAIVIDDDVHTFHINTTPENICSNQNTFLERLEGCVARDTISSKDQLSDNQELNPPLLLCKA